MKCKDKAYAGLLMGDDIGLGLASMAVYFDFFSTNVLSADQ